jgi:hypothetical protein
VRPPLLLVGGASAAALLAIVMMRPLLFPTMTKEAARAAAPSGAPSTSTFAAPAMKSGPEAQSNSAAGNAPASFSGGSREAQPPAKPGDSEAFDAAPAAPAPAASIPQNLTNQFKEQQSGYSQEAAKSAVAPMRSEQRPAAAKPQEPGPDGSHRRESDYMNVYPGDRADSPQKAPGGPDGAQSAKTESGRARAEQKSASPAAARKAKSRAKQAQRNVRDHRDQAPEPRASSSSK